MEELFAFVDGRAVTNNLSELARIRKREFDGYRKVRSREGLGIAYSDTDIIIIVSWLQGLSPPERFMTRGAVGTYFLFPTILEDLDLLKQLEVYTCTRIIIANEASYLVRSRPCCHDMCHCVGASRYRIFLNV